MVLWGDPCTLSQAERIPLVQGYCRLHVLQELGPGSSSSIGAAGLGVELSPQAGEEMWSVK